MAMAWQDFWGNIDWENDDDANIVREIENFTSAHNTPDEIAEFVSTQNDQGMTGLYLAVQYSKEKTLEKLLELDAPTELGVEKELPSSLAIAFREGNTEFAKMLIKNGANMMVNPVETWNDEQKNTFNKTKRDIWKDITKDDLVAGRALEKALERGDSAMGMVFASRGAKVNEHTNNKPSAMDIVIKNNDLNMLNHLLYASRENPVNINDVSGREEPFLNEALKKLPESRLIVSRLLAENADVNIAGNDGKNPWKILCERMENATTPEEQKIVRDIAKAMMDKGMTIDGSQTPQYLFETEFYEISSGNDPAGGWKNYDTLINLGAAEKAKDAGFRAYYSFDELDVMKSDPDQEKAHVARTWIEQDLAVLASGDTATKVCFDAIQGRDKDTLKKGLDLGINANAQNAESNTFLHEAAKVGDADIGSEILSHGADIDRRNKEGQSPLMVSICAKKKDFTDMLLAENADVNAQDNNLLTALHHAVANNNREAVEALLKKGVLVDAQTKDGDTALYIAAKKGYSDIAKLLIMAGADINKQNNAHKTPVQVAEELVSKDFANMLRVAEVTREDDALDAKWTEIGNKYGVTIIGKTAIRCGGKFLGKTCRVIKNMFKSNSNDR